MSQFTVLLAIISGCSPATSTQTGLETVTTTQASSTTTSTTTDSVLTTVSSTTSTTTDRLVPEVCEPLMDLESLPIEWMGQVQYTLGDEFFMELVDVELTTTELVAAGAGGVLWFDISAPENPSLTQRFSTPWTPAFHRVESLSDLYTAATVRNTMLAVINNGSKGQPFLVYEEALSGVEGLTHNNDTLYVSDRDQGLLVYDTSDLPNLTLLTVAEGLASPWELSEVMDGWMYAADNTFGDHRHVPLFGIASLRHAEYSDER